MSSLLYALGRLCYRRWKTVFALWFVLVVICGTVGGLLGVGTKDVYRVPGEEAFSALDRISHTFPEVSGAAGQLLVVADDGADVTSPENTARIRKVIKELKDVDQVAMVIGPWHELVSTDDTINADRTAALIQVQMETTVEQVKLTTHDQLEEVAAENSRGDLTFYAGGGAYGPEPPVISATEGVGVVVAMIALSLTFGSVIAAGLPLATAFVGIAVTMSVVWLVTRWIDVASSGPFLALMIGLAVGIDYSLFILARHRDELAQGVDPEESTGRAVATAGSAVIFAGITVVIALVGLVVTGLPFLIIMGFAAAFSVLVAIAVALTLTPAVFGFLKLRLAPKPKKVKNGKQRVGFNERWLNLVLRFPKFWVVFVGGILVALTIPALHMATTLPDNGTAHHGATQRTTYEKIEEKFGVGYNGQLVMTAEIVQSMEPLEAIEDIKRQILMLPNVQSVPIATPNPPDADTMLIQITPVTGPTDPETTELVHRLRALAPGIKEEWGFDVQVTGMTAATVDLNSRLVKALVPFGVLVMGLSLVLLAMVFRSIAVPIKATVNFILSLGATFGVTVLVFQDGWFADELHVISVGPIVCFLPIVLISLLFGLSMDYEVFLVSRIREEYVHGASAIDAIRLGYVASSTVITAAAVIMISVFAAFVPHGDVNTQPMAFALAVGVFIDAFMVRITLVPAVMALLGDKAWWMPKWLDKRLPAIDAEGEGVAHQLELAEWPSPDAHLGIHADRIRLATKNGEGVFGPLSFEVSPGSVLVAKGLSAPARTSLAYALSGRMDLTEGNLKVAGQVVPQQMIMLRPYVAMVRVEEHADPRAGVQAEVNERTRVLVVDGFDLIPSLPYREALLAEVLDHARRLDVAVVLTTSREALEHVSVTDPAIRVLDLHTSEVTSSDVLATEGVLA